MAITYSITTYYKIYSNFCLILPSNHLFYYPLTSYPHSIYALDPIFTPFAQSFFFLEINSFLSQSKLVKQIICQNSFQNFKSQIKIKIGSMNHIFHSRQQNRPASFFSTNLSPQNQTQTHCFQTEFDNDPIYFMAEQVKRKLSKTPRKQIKRDPKMLLGFVDKNKKQQNANFQTSPTNNNKTIYTSKSLNNKRQRAFNVSNTIDDERRLLSKITIHRIRSQRQQLESETKRISNSYNYLFQRIEKEKRKSIEVKIKQEKTKQIHQKSQQMKHQLENQRAMFLQQKSLEKSRLRDAVLKQKKNKQRSLVNFYNNLHKNASQVRLESQKIDQEILRTQLNEIEKKKIKYLTQKQKQKGRLLTRQKSFQNRRLQAQTHFKQKWLREFNQTSKARKTYITKKELLNKKMQKLYEGLRGQQNPFFESRQKQRSFTRVSDWKNPEQQNFHS